VRGSAADRGAADRGAALHDGYLVFLAPDGETGRAGAITVAAVARAAGAAAVQRLAHLNALVLRGDVDAAALAAHPRVARVAPNSLYHKLHALAYPTDALFWRRGWQWNLRQIRADQAATSGVGRRVCIVDGGVHASHQDLQGKVVAARAFPGTTPYARRRTSTATARTWAARHVERHRRRVGRARAALMNANVFGPDAATSVARSPTRWRGAPAAAPT
jgi:hypothetical protein